MKRAPIRGKKFYFAQTTFNGYLSEDSTAWEHLIKLYPYLVECTTTSSTQVSRPLREALLQFCDLLQPPITIKKNHSEKT